MALIVIIVKDTPEGPSVNVQAEPALPQNVMQGPPSPAQTAAAVMLNALSRAAGPQEEPSRIITPH
jgi:hypothetical protein